MRDEGVYWTDANVLLRFLMAEEVIVAEKQRTEIDAGLLEELRRRAKEQGRLESELLEEAVRRSLLVLAPRRSGSLEELRVKSDRRF